MNVALLIFNRPDVTARVFARIREARPDRLFVIADGPRPDRPGEADLVAATRAVAGAVDWPCEVTRDYSDTNLGCGRRVATGISGVFDAVEEAVILEDDCLPHPSFFGFCGALLDRYRHDHRVTTVGGANFQGGVRRGAGSYYFSKYMHCWGWATWRRAWRHYDRRMAAWPAARDAGALAAVHPDPRERAFWEGVLDRTHRGEVDTWDYPWQLSCWLQHGLTALPNVNLVTNLGFGPGGDAHDGKLPAGRPAGRGRRPAGAPAVRAAGRRRGRGVRGPDAARRAAPAPHAAVPPGEPGPYAGPGSPPAGPPETLAPVTAAPPPDTPPDTPRGRARRARWLFRRWLRRTFLWPRWRRGERTPFVVFGHPARLDLHPTAQVSDALFNLSSGTVSVGPHAFFGHRVMVLTGRHDVETYGPDRAAAFPGAGGDVTIGEGVWVASGATILGPCRVGPHAVVAAGALVTRDVPAGAVVVGAPARVVRRLPGPDGTLADADATPPADAATLPAAAPPPAAAARP